VEESDDLFDESLAWCIAPGSIRIREMLTDVSECCSTE